MILHTHPKEVNKARYILVISETVGYFVNGIEVTSRVSVGRRSLKIKDYAKISQAVRLRPVTHVLELAKNYFPLEKRAYFA